MATELFANLASTTVSSGGTTAPAPGTTETWTVASSASFPTAVSGTSQFHIQEDDATKQSEIILVTNVSGTTWSVTRGVEGTTPVAHTAGFTVVQTVTASTLTSFYSSGNPPPYPVTTVAGRAGAVTLTAADIGSGTFPAGVAVPSGSFFRLAGISDLNHYIGYNATPNGPDVAGFAGGRLGYTNGGSFTPQLAWSTTGVTVAGTLSSTGNLSENGNRVFSAGNFPTLAQVASGTSSAAYSFTGLVAFTGTTIIGNKSLWNGTRTLPGSGNAVDLGTFTSTNGAFQINLMVTVDVSGFAVTKSYEIDVTGSVGSASTWYRVVPSDSTQNETLTGTDFILEVNRNATTNAYTFRLRQIGATGGTLYWQSEGYGTASLAFTPSTSTTAAPASVSALWSPTPLFTGPGVVGINNDNPAYALDVVGSTKIQTADGSVPLRVLARTVGNGGQSGNLLEFTDANGTIWTSFDASGSYSSLLNVTANNLQAGVGLGSGQLLMNTLSGATSGSQNINSAPILLRTNYWTGSAAANDDLTLTAVHYSAASGRVGLSIANADAITFGTTGVISMQTNQTAYGDNMRFNRGAAGAVAIATGPSSALLQTNGLFTFYTGASATAGAAVTTTIVSQFSVASADFFVPVTLTGTTAALSLGNNGTAPTASTTRAWLYTLSGRSVTKDGLGGVWPVDSPLPGRLSSTQTNSTVTSSVVDGTNLSAAIPGAGTYLIEWEGTYSAAATTTGLRLQINVGATGATGLFGYNIFTSAAGAASVGGNTTFGGQFGSTSASAAGTFLPWRVWTTVVCTGSGTVDLLFASGVAASAVNVQGGAFRKLTRIA